MGRKNSFAGLTPEKRFELQSKGGKITQLLGNSMAVRFTSESARAALKKRWDRYRAKKKAEWEEAQRAKEGTPQVG